MGKGTVGKREWNMHVMKEEQKTDAGIYKRAVSGNE